MNCVSAQQLLERYRPGWSLGQHYTDPGIFDLEWKHIWKKYWLFAGTTAEILNPATAIASIN